MRNSSMVLPCFRLGAGRCSLDALGVVAVDVPEVLAVDVPEVLAVDAPEALAVDAPEALAVDAAGALAVGVPAVYSADGSAVENVVDLPMLLLVEDLRRTKAV
jgi:hypothetical protein